VTDVLIVDTMPEVCNEPHQNVRSGPTGTEKESMAGPDRRERLAKAAKHLTAMVAGEDGKHCLVAH
jgi:hypothetical protein